MLYLLTLLECDEQYCSPCLKEAALQGLLGLLKSGVA